MYEFQQIAAGNYHALAVDDCGHLYTWGCNGNGQLGDDSITNRSLPVHHKEAYRYINYNEDK